MPNRVPWTERVFSFDFPVLSLVERLESLPPDLVDMPLFHAEHDAYHLARIRELLRIHAAGEPAQPHT